MPGYRIVLASGSPRRRAIMTGMGLEFTVVTSGVDETLHDYDGASDFTVQVARRKALAVARSEPEALVVGCDTVVGLDGRIFVKPDSEQDAARTLRELRGRTHHVTTGVVVVHGVTGRCHGRSATTAVTMRAFGDDEIAAYVASGEPLDKAGSYAIQGAGGALVDRIDGEYDTVVGLPVSVLTDLLREFDRPDQPGRTVPGLRPPGVRPPGLRPPGLRPPGLRPPAVS
ncbi:Maf family protein [Parafrankia elaeagni]|uniref:Maf family protein n=1 Tax=Parafrankia elaeagni TaxID=222534 RepID=UPI001E308AB7|nr:Maf family protein [Parafrankia elaeagni]